MLSIVVRDIRFAGDDGGEMIRGRALYEKFRRGEPLTADEAADLLPARSDCAAVYRALRSGGGYRGTAEDLFHRMPKGGTGFAKFLTALAVFTDRGLIRCKRSGNTTYSVQLLPAKGKVSLEKSPLSLALQSFRKAGGNNGGTAENV